MHGNAPNASPQALWLLTVVLGGVLAWLFLGGGRRRFAQRAGGEDAAAALVRLLDGTGARREPTAAGRAMESIFDSETGSVAEEFCAAHAHLGSAAEDKSCFAEGLKAEGNAKFKQGHFIPAASCYAKALIALEGAVAPVAAGSATQDLGDARSLACGQRVSILLREDAQIEAEGIICCDNEDGTYDCILDNGDDRDSVPLARIRPLPSSADGDGDEESDRQRSLMAACLINSARCAFQVEHFSLSAALATRAIQLNPANPASFFVRGRAHLAIPYLDLAKQVCHGCIAILARTKCLHPPTPAMQSKAMLSASRGPRLQLSHACLCTHSWQAMFPVRRCMRQDLRQACLVAPQNVEYRKTLADVNERIKIRNQVCELQYRL